MVSNNVTLVVRVNKYISQFRGHESSKYAEEWTKLHGTSAESSHIFADSFVIVSDMPD